MQQEVSKDGRCPFWVLLLELVKPAPVSWGADSTLFEFKSVQMTGACSGRRCSNFKPALVSWERILLYLNSRVFTDGRCLLLVLLLE
jgi:hypothetical protein